MNVSDVVNMEDTISCNITINASFVMSVSGNPRRFSDSKSWCDFFQYDESDTWIDISTWLSAWAKIKLAIVIDRKDNRIISFDPISVDGDHGFYEFKW